MVIKLSNYILLLILALNSHMLIAQPGNDLCDDAEILCKNIPLMGSTAGANPECTVTGCLCPPCFNVINTVWFTFTTTST